MTYERAVKTRAV